MHECISLCCAQLIKQTVAKYTHINYSVHYNEGVGLPDYQKQHIQKTTTSSLITYTRTSSTMKDEDVEAMINRKKCLLTSIDSKPELSLRAVCSA